MSIHPLHQSIEHVAGAVTPRISLGVKNHLSSDIPNTRNIEVTRRGPRQSNAPINNAWNFDQTDALISGAKADKMVIISVSIGGSL